MNTQIAMIMGRLEARAVAPLDEHTRSLFARDIEGKLTEGWRASEITGYISLTEEIAGNEKDEDVTLREMSEIRALVLARIDSERDAHGELGYHTYGLGYDC